jgi:hypothetical protein
MENYNLLPSIKDSAHFLKAIALQGRMVLGDLPSGQEFVDWAIATLVDGYESPTLIVLAGLSNLDHPQDIRDYWFKVCIEMDLGLPKLPEEAISIYAHQICTQILSGEIAVMTGHQILYQIWLTANLNGDPWSHKYAIWMYLQDSLELVESGYEVLLPQLKGLSSQRYDYFVKQEAANFLIHPLT